MSLEEIRRRSTEEYRKAWRVNWIWLIAALVVVFTTPKLKAQLGWWEIGSGVFLIVIVCLTFWRSKHGEIGTEDRYRALSISRDPHGNELERKRNGLLFWAGGGLFGLLPGAGPTLILLLIAFPLFMCFVRWVVDAPYPPNISPTRVWVAFIAFVILCVAWVFVRTLNLRAARAMRAELEALDSSEEKQ